MIDILEISINFIMQKYFDRPNR